MRLVSLRQEPHHRGYHIEGLKQGEGMLLRVNPTRPCLPTLRYSRFRTLRGSWVKAIGVVAKYIDEELNAINQEYGRPDKPKGQRLHQVKSTGQGGVVAGDDAPRSVYFRNWAMAETVLELAARQVSRGVRLARYKQLIAELKAQGADTSDAESTLDTLLSTQRFLEEHLQGMRKQRGLD